MKVFAPINWVEALIFQVADDDLVVDLYTALSEFKDELAKIGR